jgi:hypothetical protein
METCIEKSASDLSIQDLAAEGGQLLPDKEVLSILDLFVNLDLALDLAAPIDLAVAANANIAAPIDAAASVNLLATDSSSGALAEQAALINQHLAGEAIATGSQDAAIDQSNGVVDPGTGVDTTVAEGTGDRMLDGPLLNVDVNVDLNADLAAPVAGAVAANANAAAPIDAAVSANVGTIGSDSTAVADQTAIINQDLDGAVAEATADQDAQITP